MKLDLITFIIFYLLIVLSTLGIGFFTIKITNLNKYRFSYGYSGLFGIFFLLIYSYLSHFFIPHNYLNNSFLIIFGLISFFLSIKKKISKEKIILLLIVFLILLTTFKTSDLIISISSGPTSLM